MIDDYRKAYKRGKRQVSLAIAQGQHPFPPSLDEALEGRGSAGELPLGIMEIPLRLVVGTKTRSRSNMFSKGFLPIADEATEFAGKWSTLFDAQRREGIQDPIKVYEYLQRFYVQEGNKRVSVLRYLGAPTILASVTRVLPAASDDAVVRRYHEFERLYRVAPIFGFDFSREGSCAQLAKLMGRDLENPWPEDDVRYLAATWYQFCDVFKARGGDAPALTAADAFLEYLKAYMGTDRERVSNSVMSKRLDRIWSELAVAANPEPIAYIENPTVARPKLSTQIKGLRRGVLTLKPLRMAFIYDSNPSSSGWCAQHEEGRVQLEERLAGGVDTTIFFDRSTDATFERAVEAAEADKTDVIVSISPRQMELARKAAAAHPKMLFINCSVNLSSSKVRSFYARMYEVKYLMGALAASMAENHRIGYLASSPIYGSVAEINAFALGAALVDPYATVFLKWRSTEGLDWQRELGDADVRVIAGEDYPNPSMPGEPYGLFTRHSDNRIERVATPIWDWARYYELMVRSIQDESWSTVGDTHRDQAINYWWGMSAGVVRLELGAGAALGTRKLMGLLERALIDGDLRPFDGVLAAQRGVAVRTEEAPGLTSEEIASMRWLNDNVVGRLPKTWELTPEASDAVAASGVISAETDAAEE